MARVTGLQCRLHGIGGLKGFKFCITGYNKSTSCGGSAAYVKGGLFTNCRVLDSTDDSWCYYIYSLVAEGGTVRNTLICGIHDDTTVCSATTITPLYIANGTVENVTVTGCDPGSSRFSVISGGPTSTISATP